MEVVRTVAELRAVVDGWRAAGLASAVVPTMGGLHEGHASLVRHGLSLVDRVVATLFVNPTQFGANEDLDSYPRDEARDISMLRDAGCGALFAPALTEMYPPGFSTRVVVDGLTDVLCGAARPGHFDGVSQVVSKLLNQARCDIAVFGEKDWQQLAVVTRVAQDLDIATRIVGAPTVREADGLAMSSRNRYLTAAEREIAPRLAAEMREAARRIAGGASVVRTCRDAERAVIAAGFLAVDYLEVRTADDLAPVETFDPATPIRIFGAAHLGRARLIDNMAIA
ncbi:MAG: pantoate--beta-alanine ligase [Pseudomonadota bacterium]